ncbi:MAG: ABC transporter ATP-binding protein [Rhodospirillales bacterium]
MSSPEANRVDDIILETKNLTKEFKGFTAVNGVNLRIQRGRIHALIGPNGAGKTTCFNLLTKFLVPTSGQIIYNGRSITGASPAQIAKQGITRSFQISAVFLGLTALENVRISLQRELGTGLCFWKSAASLSRLNERAHSYLAEVGLADFADTRAGGLVYGQKRALEIATTLAAKPELLLLDEPTAGLASEELGPITNLIKKVSKDRTTVIVEHNMQLVANICDTVTVLQRGSIIAEGSYAEVAADPLVMEAYLGSDDDFAGTA